MQRSGDLFGYILLQHTNTHTFTFTLNSHSNQPKKREDKRRGRVAAAHTSISRCSAGLGKSCTIMWCSSLNASPTSSQ